MNLNTPVEIPSGFTPISHAQQLLIMGSCFAENIGTLLAENKFRIDINPFGILYNPRSISMALRESSAKSNTKHPICFCIVNVGTARCITALSPPPPLQTPYGISNPVWNRHIKS